jgi:hypothetical protein
MPSKKRAKKQTQEKSARAIQRGAVVLRNRQEEVVRSVSVVFHLANGIDHVVDADESVTLVIDLEPETE